MPDHVQGLSLTYFSIPPDPSNTVVIRRTVNAYKSIRPISCLLSTYELYTTVDFRIVNCDFRSFRVAHSESKNETDICYVASIHTVFSCGDDVRCNEEFRTESPSWLVPEALLRAQVMSCPKVLDLQYRCAVSIVNHF